MGKRGIRHKQILDDLKETRGYLKLKTGALHRSVCRTPFGRGYRTLSYDILRSDWI